VSAKLEKKIFDSISRLNAFQQKKLIHFIDSLLQTAKKKSDKNPLLKFAGSISKSDLILMERAIEDGCENIDVNEW
jgi:hypothetical protein